MPGSLLHVLLGSQLLLDQQATEKYECEYALAGNTNMSLSF